MRFVRIIKSALYLSLSISNIKADDFNKALEYLIKSGEFRAVVDGKYLLLRGYVYGALSHRKEAIDDLKQAVDFFISRGGKMGLDERKYLINYASMLASFAECYESPFCLFDDVNEDSVRSYFIKTFPFNIDNVIEPGFFSKEVKDKVLFKLMAGRYLST